MTRITEPRLTENAPDDAFLTALRESPRPAFAASLYLRLSAQDAPQAAWHDHAQPNSVTDIDASSSRHVSPRPMRRPWSWLTQAAMAAGTAILILGVIAMSALLLRSRLAPAVIEPGGAPTAAATLLYAGQLAGRSGIIAVESNGSQERLLVEGDYIGVASSPDGSRFLAYGTTLEAQPNAIVDLYDANGQLLRRYALGQTLPLIVYWAPDSRHAALFARTGDAPARQGDVFQTWLLDELGAHELRLGGATAVGTPSGTAAWSPQGRLLIGVRAEDSNSDGRISAEDDYAAWTVNADGGEARKLFSNLGAAIGWSSTGSTAYVIGPTQVLAIDDTTGEQRVVASVEEVGRQMQPTSPADAARLRSGTFGSIPANALVATPTGDRLALWLTPATAVGDTTTPTPYLVVIDQQGRVVGQDRPTAAGTVPTFTAWAADASRLAYGYRSSDGSRGVRVLDIATGVATTPAVLNGLATSSLFETSLRWSPDGRYLAVAWNRQTTVAGGEGLANVWTAAGMSSGWPNWQPAAAP